MIRKSRLELAVGIFIVIGLIILVAFVFLIRDFQIVKPGYKFDIVFGFANGLKVSAPVKLAGVDVGEVKETKVYYDQDSLQTKVRVRVWVNQEARIPSDSQVWINTLGLLGEKYIELIPGQNYGLSVKSGDTIAGQDPIALQEITEEAKKMILKLDQALSGLNEILGKIHNGEGTIGKFVYEEAIYNNLEAMTDDLRRHPWKLFWKTKERLAPTPKIQSNK